METLLRKANKMSVYQEIVYQMAVNTKKIIDTEKPNSIHKQIVKKEKLGKSVKKTTLRNKQRQIYLKKILYAMK